MPKDIHHITYDASRFGNKPCGYCELPCVVAMIRPIRDPVNGATQHELIYVCAIHATLKADDAATYKER